MASMKKVSHEITIRRKSIHFIGTFKWHLKVFRVVIYVSKWQFYTVQCYMRIRVGYITVVADPRLIGNSPAWMFLSRLYNVWLGCKNTKTVLFFPWVILFCVNVGWLSTRIKYVDSNMFCLLLYYGVMTKWNIWRTTCRGGYW